MRKLITCIILVFCLCGCSGQISDMPEKLNDGEPAGTAPATTPIALTPELIEELSPEPTSSGDVTTPVFSFDAPIADGLPEFTFEVYKTELQSAGLEAYEYDVRVSCGGLSEYEPQTIKIESSANWTEDGRPAYLDLVDIDFDGYADIQAYTSSGMVNVNYAYYRWNVFSGQGYGEFEETPFFEMLTTGYELYPDTKQIISTSRDSAVNHPREMYQLSDAQNGGWLGEYRLIRREEQELTPDGELTVRIFFGDEEIYSETAALDGDGYTASGKLDNYLRFGVGDPIDMETAAQLLYDEYGEEDSGTGFPYSFSFEEMMVFEKLSCYKFRMQWLVDDGHLSTLGFAGVTPDGRIINQVD